MSGVLLLRLPGDSKYSTLNGGGALSKRTQLETENLNIEDNNNNNNKNSKISKHNYNTT